MGFHKVLTNPPTHALSPVIPPNAWHLCLTAAAGTELAVPSSGAPQNLVTPDRSLHPEGLNLHAASLRHTCVHCGRFVTAAPRRSLGSVSVPMWPANLSVRLRVVALVSRYLTNKLIRNRPLPDRRTFEHKQMPVRGLIWYYLAFRLAIPESGVR